MALSYVAERLPQTTISTSGATVSPTANMAAGNDVFLLIGSTVETTTGVSVSDSAGNTWTIDVSQSAEAYVAIAHCHLTTALTTSDTITISFTSGSLRVMMVEFSAGAGNQLVLDQTASASRLTRPQASVDCGTTATTTIANEVVIGFYMMNAAHTSSAGTGYTIFDTTASLRCDGVYKIATTTGAQNPTATSIGTTLFGAVTATYYATPTGGPSTPTNQFFQLCR